MTLLLFAAGLVALVVGAEILVRGAAALAAAARISPLVIGLTVVAFGTSAPELAVSVQSALRHEADLAVGNVVGSNIFNVLLILGISSLLTPLVVSRQLIRFDVPLMIGVSLVMLLLGLDGRIGRTDGLLLLTGLVVYVVWSVVQSRRENHAAEPDTSDDSAGSTGRPAWFAPVIQLSLIVGGLSLLVLGSSWLVESAAQMARWAGVSELVIGLTIVAGGTSLPEVATSVVAALRGQRDISVGNVVGSNIFNILGVLGAAGAVASDGIAVSADALHLDVPVMIGAAVACLPVFFTGHLIARWEGALFLGYYVAYASYLVLQATNHPAAAHLGIAMAVFVLPLTAITLLVCVARAWRQPAV